MQRFKTAGEIVSDAARDLGLSESNDPFASSDSIFQRLCGYFQDCGEELLHAHHWGQLRKVWEFTTQLGDTGDYPLPADWHEVVPGTSWNKTARLPVGGPLSAQEWAYLNARLSGVSVTVFGRIETNFLRLYPQPPMAGVLISMEYASRAWVVPTAKIAQWTAGNYQTLGVDGEDEVVASTDVALFDPQLMKLLLKLKWRQYLGFDTEVEKEDYKAFLERTKSSVDPAPTLSISGPSLHFRLVDESNLPPTGYGR